MDFFHHFRCVTVAGPDGPLGKQGKCPGTHAFGGVALECQNTPLLVFHDLGCSPHIKIVELFDCCFCFLTEYTKAGNSYSCTV